MDHMDLRPWLLARPEATRQKDAALIAMRAAARVFPLSGRGWETHDLVEEKAEKLARDLLLARCILMGQVAALSFSPEIRAALISPCNALLCASNVDPNPYTSAGNAVANAVDILVVAPNDYQQFGNYLANQLTTSSVHSMAIAQTAALFLEKSAADHRLHPDVLARDATWQQVAFDIVSVGSVSGLLSKPLWATRPVWFSVLNEQMLSLWASDQNDTWNFWTRWWDGLVAGRPLDWALQEKVALIPDDIWQQGPAAVARAIRDIEEAMTPLEPSDTGMEKVIEQTRHGAVLFYDPDTKLIGEEAVSTLPQDVRRDVVDLMQDVLSGFPAASAGNNSYELIRRERDILKRAIDAYGARPWMLINSLRRARAGVQDKVADGTCPQNDPLLNDLVAQIVQAEILLITHDAELAVADRNQNNLPDLNLSANDLHILTAGMQALQGHATPELYEAIAADLATIADTNLPISIRRASMLSTLGRIFQTSAIVTMKGIRAVYRGTRFTVAEAAGWSRDLGEIGKNTAFLALVAHFLRLLFGI